MTTISSTAASSLSPYNTSYTNPVSSSTKDAGLSKTAAKLGQDSAVIANLSGSTTKADALGLYNSIVQAGSSSKTSTPTTTSPAQAAVSTLGSSTPSTSGIYNASGTVQSSSSSLNADWAKVLSGTPSAAKSLTADSFNQGILSTISTTA